MGLLDMLNKGGGLFDPIAQSSDRGFDLQKMMANTEPPAPPQFAPPQERGQGRGGVFGSGYNGEDIMSMLLRAAAIAQGDYGAGAQFGQNIGAKARAEAEAAQKRQNDFADWQQRADYTRQHEAPDVAPMVRDTEAYIQMPEEKRRAWAEMQAILHPPAGDKYVINDGQIVRVPGAMPQASGPSQAHIQALQQNPERAADFDTKFGQGASSRYLGGGTGNGAGGFPRR